jgi:hypothetical protein
MLTSSCPNSQGGWSAAPHDKSLLYGHHTWGLSNQLQKKHAHGVMYGLPCMGSDLLHVLPACMLVRWLLAVHLQEGNAMNCNDGGIFAS